MWFLNLPGRELKDYVIKDESLIDNLMIAVEDIFPKND